VIIRIFRATIRKDRISDFKKMVQEQSIPWLEGTDGMLGYYPGEPLGDDGREFVMITLWRDQAALEAFAGLQWASPVVTEDEAPLVETMFAEHFSRFDKNLQSDVSG
jgi:quinol monooxygenase YgiN